MGSHVVSNRDLIVEGAALAEVVFVGLSTMDIVYAVDEFPAANSKVAALSQDLYVGGPATNAAITFAHLGGRSTLVTAVGRHSLAGAIKAEIEQRSVTLIDLNPNFSEPPVLSSIYVNRLGQRNIVSANAIRVNVPVVRVDEAALERGALVLVDGHYMQACQEWARAARSLGIQVVLDGGSWKEGTDELLGFADTAICSNDFKPPGCANEDEVIDYLIGRGVANIAITKGAHPIRFQSDAASGSVRVPLIEPVDTMGAGDIFHGAFCYFSSNGTGFAEALAEAAKIAAESCRFKGTREWMRHCAGATL
jgi:sugar/nucleoside kinase (ribokinase family)